MAIQWDKSVWTSNLEKQRQREDYLIQRGVQRFDRKAEKTDTHGAGRRLLAEATEDTAEIIYRALTQVRRGPKHIALTWVPQLDEDLRAACDKAAFLACKVVLSHLGTEPPTLRRMALGVFSQVLQEIKYDRMARLAPHLFEHKIRKFQEEHTSSYTWMSRSMDAAYTAAQCTACYKAQLPCEHLAEIPTSQKDALHVGFFLISAFVEATREYTLSPGYKAGVVEVRNIRRRVGRRIVSEQTLIRTEGALVWLKEKNRSLSLWAPEHGPMLVPPLHWGPKQRGGYRFRIQGRYPVMRGGHTLKEMPHQHSEVFYSALNRIQDTAWRINRDVLAVVGMVKEVARLQRRTVAGVPSPEPVPEPPNKPHFKPEWEALSEAERKVLPEFQAFRAWRYKKGKAKKAEAARIVKQHAFDSLLRVAERHASEDAFWFVWNCDFRGRIYPLSDYLSPQGTDLSKALLTFADPRPMGSMGGRWLAIHLANCMKKTPQGVRVSTMTLDERERWVLDHEAEVLAVAEDPMGNMWWTETGEPLRFYAACVEWARYADSGYAPDHESGLPIAMDGSNNGVQHFAAAWKDPRLAKLVNVTANSTPRDLYAELADLVTHRLAEDAVVTEGPAWTEAGKPTAALYGRIAMKWLHSGWVDRSLVKRPGMTIGYGAVKAGFLDQLKHYLISEGLFEQAKDTFQFEDSKQNKRTQVMLACRYLGGVIWDCLEQLVPAVFEHRAWLQECARILVSQGKPVTWTVPGTGVQVAQMYYQWDMRRVKTRLAGAVVMPSSYTETDRLKKQKQANAIAPNWVHSLDAAALMMTVQQAAASGIESFAMVHDSYAVPAGDAEVMVRTLRQEFYRLYAEYNPVEQLHAELQEQSNEPLPEPAPGGALDISEVLVSDYFFA